MKKFALIGTGGYIAPRHLKAIKETGNVLVAALDKNDSVGILDTYFPDASFFTEFERFDRHLERLRRDKNQAIQYVSICSPNYLHDAHVRFALRIGATAICEKPLVLNPWNVTALAEAAKETGQHINTILQLRLHPAIIALKERVQRLPEDKTFDIDLTYITSRGSWYMTSWKGDVSKSGGIATNIGVHFFDVLSWIFGGVKENTVHVHEPTKAAGLLELDRARIRWFLSLDRNDLPFAPEVGKSMTYRSITVDGDEIEFSGGFTDLHTKSYRRILDGKGFGPQDVMTSIEIVSAIRNATPVGLRGDHHPMLTSPSSSARAVARPDVSAVSASPAKQILGTPDRTSTKGNPPADRRYFVHETGIVENGAEIGEGTKIWHFSHVMKGATIGKNCIFGQNVFVASDVVIGNNVKIQNNVSIYSGVIIEDDVFLGPACVLTNVNNPRSQIIRHGLYEKTIFRRGVTVGANATIICGIELGRYSFIAAGAVVTKDVPDYAMMVGVPARNVGWISRHAIPLPKPDSDGIMVCPESKYRYKEVETGVLRCIDLDEEAPLPSHMAVGKVSYRKIEQKHVDDPGSQT